MPYKKRQFEFCTLRNANGLLNLIFLKKREPQKSLKMAQLWHKNEEMRKIYTLGMEPGCQSVESILSGATLVQPFFA